MKPLKLLLATSSVRRMLCWILAQYLRFVHATGRWAYINEETPQRLWDQGQPMIGCFWHGRLWMIPWSWRWPGTARLLISGHRDGLVIADTIRWLGFKVATGSSSRGGKAAVRELLAALKAGETIGVTPDGPRGPRMRARMGVIRIASLSGAPIVPVSFGARRRRIVNSWDRFVVVWPFNSGVLIYGKEIRVPRHADAEALEQARRRLEESLNAITVECDRMTGHAPVAPADPDPSSP